MTLLAGLREKTQDTKEQQLRTDQIQALQEADAAAQRVSRAFRPNQQPSQSRTWQAVKLSFSTLLFPIKAAGFVADNALKISAFAHKNAPIFMPIVAVDWILSKKAPEYALIATSSALIISVALSQLKNIQSETAYRSIFGRVFQAVQVVLLTIATQMTHSKLIEVAPEKTRFVTQLGKQAAYESLNVVQSAIGRLFSFISKSEADASCPKVGSDLSQYVHDIETTLQPYCPAQNIETALQPYSPAQTSALDTVITGAVMLYTVANLLPNIIIGNSAFGRPYGSTFRRLVQTALIMITAHTLIQRLDVNLPALETQELIDFAAPGIQALNATSQFLSGLVEAKKIQRCK